MRACSFASPHRVRKLKSDTCSSRRKEREGRSDGILPSFPLPPSILDNFFSYEKQELWTVLSARHFLQLLATCAPSHGFSLSCWLRDHGNETGQARKGARCSRDRAVSSFGRWCCCWRQESGCFATTDRVRAVGEHAAVSQCPPPARKVEVWSLEEVDKLTADRT